MDLIQLNPYNLAHICIGKIMLKFVDKTAFEVMDGDTCIGAIRKYPNGAWEYSCIVDKSLMIDAMKQIVEFVEVQKKKEQS